MTRYGLTGRMADVLRILAECPDLPLADLARDLGLSRHQFYDAQQRLMARERLATDGRTVLGPPPPFDERPVELTPAGRSAAGKGCDNVSH